jgi:putative two-component system response regulator
MMDDDEPAATDESARLAALERYAIIDTPAEEDFNQLVELAALAFRVPWAAITFVDGFRAWRKAAYPADELRETPRVISFCGQTIEGGDVMVVPDAAADLCFKHFPNVSGGKVRFYAGAPLVTVDGYRIGTLCILDNAPRDLDETQIEMLRGFAREAMHRIDTRLKLARANDMSRQFGRVIKEFPIGVVTCDMTGRVMSCSPVAERITGWTEGELSGKECPFILSGHEAEFRLLLAAVKRGETVVREHCQLRRKNGSLVDVRLSCAPLFSKDGAVIGFVAVGEDISVADAGRQRSRVLEAAVLSAFSRAVIVTTAEPDPKIVYVNPSFTQMYGFDAKEVLGQSERMLRFEGENPDSAAKIREARRTQTPLNVEVLHRRKDGAAFWCELGLTPVIEADGRCEHWVAFAADVTERRRAEQLQHDRTAIVEMMAENAPPERILQGLATWLSAAGATEA